MSSFSVTKTESSATTLKLVLEEFLVAIPFLPSSRCGCMMNTGILSLKLFAVSAPCGGGDLMACPAGTGAAEDKIFSVVLVGLELGLGLSPRVEVGVVVVLVKDVTVDELGSS